MDIPRTSDAVRSDWGTSVEVAPGLHRIRLENPQGALMVNTYAYRGGDAFVLVDPGWPWSREHLEAALRELGLGRLNEVDHILYTHSHIDHMGLAAVFSEELEIPQYCWSGLADELPQWHAFQDRMNDWSDWGVRALAGEARERARELYSARADAPRKDRMLTLFGELPVTDPVLMEWGDVIRVGDLELEWVDARGHCPFHGAFFERNRGWLFAGDVVLATPTPISRAMDDDVQLYRDSLDRLEALEASMLLPGHGVQRGGDLSRAFDRARGYLDHYSKEVFAQLEAADTPLGVFDIALAMTPDGKPYRPSARWWVHLALVDSHLVDHVRLGHAERLEHSDGPRYRIVR